MVPISAILRLITPLLFAVITRAAPSPVPTPAGRLSTAPVDWTGYQYRDDAGLGTYSFGYDIEDPVTDNLQYRNEERHANGTVSGSYGYLQPDGNIHNVEYVADQHGYRATVRIKSRGQLKPVPVNEATVHDDVFSALEAANTHIGIPWRRSPGFYHQKQYNSSPVPTLPSPYVHAVRFQKPAGPVRIVPTVRYVAPVPTVGSLLFDINGQQEHIALGDDGSHLDKHIAPGEVLEILPGFVTLNQGTYPAPPVVYLRK